MPAVDFAANPFRVLGVSIRSTRDEIVAAYEDALVDGHQHDEATLLRAQQALLAPKARLEAELDWLPELPPARTKQVIDSLEKAQSPTDGELLLEGVAGISRANISAVLCHRFPGKPPFASALIETWIGISTEAVTMALAGQRSAAGFTKPDLRMVNEALTRVEERHAKAALASVTSEPHPGRVMAEIIGRHLSQGTQHSFLATLFRQYDLWSVPKLRDISDSISTEMAGLRKNAKDANSATKICKLLPVWDEFSQPIQLIEQAKRLDEPRTMKLVNELRDLCLWLANDQQQYDAALAISEAVRRSFSELPYVVRQVSEDIETLRGLAAEAKQQAILAPLIAAVELAKTDQLGRFDADLLSHGFSSTAHGLAKRLYDAFDTAVKGTQFTKKAEIPWLIVRDLAIALHNEQKRTDVAYAITRALLYHSSNKPPEIRAQLEKDESQLRRELRMAEMNRAAQRGDVGSGIGLADEILSLTDDANERQSILAIKAQLQRRKSARTIKWLFWGGAAVAGVAWLVVENLDAGRPRYTPTTTTTAPASTAYVPPTLVSPTIVAEGSKPALTNEEINAPLDRNSLPLLPEVSTDGILDAAAEPSAGWTANAKVMAESLRLRAGPGTNYGVVTTLQRGTPVQTFGPPNADGWVNVRTSDGGIGYVAAKFLSPDQSMQPSETTPVSQSNATTATAACVETTGLPNGAILERHGKGPHKLRIDNGTGRDAVVKVKTLAGRTILAFFINANSEAAAQTIPDGIYQIVFATGSRWSKNCGRFLDDMQAMEFEGTTVFQTTIEGQYEIYTSWTYTLHTVADGTVHLNSIPTGSF